MIVKGLQAQSFYDLAIVYTGMATNAVAIAIVNAMLVSDAIEGVEIIIPDELPNNKKVIDFFARETLKPATYENV